LQNFGRDGEFEHTAELSRKWLQVCREEDAGNDAESRKQGNAVAVLL